MKIWKILLIVLAAVVIFAGIELSYGYFGVLKTKTVTKAQKDADREVFEQTQSYVEGKRQMALKYYKEYMKSDDDEKLAIKELVSLEFANVDENDILKGKVRTFVYNCKYN